MRRVHQDISDDHKALIFSAGEREFVTRLCQDYRMTVRLRDALSTGGVSGSPGSLEIVGRVKTHGTCTIPTTTRET